MKILKLVFEGLDFFHDSRVEVDFTAGDKVTEEHTTYNLFKSIYSQNTIAFVGINATGKTTMLRLTEMAMQIILDHDDLNALEHTQLIKDRLKITAYIWVEKEIIEWKADLIWKKEQESNFHSNEKRVIFDEEVIRVKKVSTLKNKKDVFEFDDIKPSKIRSKILESEEGLYLKNTVSILIGYQAKMKGYFSSLLRYTNINVCPVQGPYDFSNSLEVFDSNLEYIKVEDKNEDINYIIKFKGDDNLITLDGMLSLEKVISAGTIKGQNILLWLFRVLLQGGYLLIDEIENHLNKEIIHLIYDIFNSKKTNPKGATLIFTTHYIEVLDFLTRKDNIYVTRKRENKIEIIRFSDEINRNDVKKSDIILKNLIEGTAPSFLAISRLKEAIENALPLFGEEEVKNE